MGGPGDNSDDKNQGGSNQILAKSQLQFKAVVISPASTDDVAPWTSKYIFSLLWGIWKQWMVTWKSLRDAKHAAQERISLVEKNEGDLSQSGPFMKDLVEELLVDKESSGDKSVSLGVERNLLKEF